MNKYIALTILSIISVSVFSQIDTTSIDLERAVVTGTRNATDERYLPMTISVINREKLTENARTNILPTLTEQVPGLFTSSRGMLGYGVSGGGAGEINLRGISGGAGQLLVLIDGHPQYQGVYSHPVSDSYQTMIADHVEILRGPASVLYGSNAMGGVINIITRDMKHDGVSTDIHLGAGSWGSFSAEASNQYRKGRFSSTAAAQYQRSDNHRPNMGFEQYGGYLKLNYKLNDNWKVFTDGNITRFNASNPGKTDALLLEARQWITRGAVAFGIDNHYNRTSGRFTVYDNFGIHKINDGHSAGTAPQSDLFRSKDYLLGISWYQSANLFQGNRTTVGVDYQHIYGHAYYTDRESGEEVTSGRRINMKQSGKSHRNDIAGYVDFRQDLLSWLTIDLGIRLDHHSVSGTEWVPQGGLVVRPIINGEMKAMISKGFRNPSMREMYLYPPSNEDLRPERMMNYELTWKHRLLSNMLTYGVNLFYIKADNLIQTTTIEGKPRNINTGEVENIGAELELAWRINRHWSVNTNHSFLHMHRHVLAAPEYKGYIGVNFRQGRWSTTAGLMQVSGIFTEIGANEKKEHFTLLNATIGYQLSKNIRLWAKGDNLLAQRYEINTGFPMPRATFMGGVDIHF